MVVRRGDPCTIENCGKPVQGRGWCPKHYATWHKYGDPLHETRRYVQQGPECAHDGCLAKPKRRGLCEKHAKRQAKHGETTDPRERNFWAQVDENGPVSEHRPDLGPCWVWTGYIHEVTGYGQFGVRNGTRLVHRIAYQYTVGPIPKGLHLDHLCHTADPQCSDTVNCPHRRCCNPAHLEPVTPRENIARGRGGDSWGYVPDPPPAAPKAAKPVICTKCRRTDKPVYKSGLCRPCYRKWLKDPNAERPSQRTPEQRFWAKVSKNGPVPPHRPDLGPCWLWTASVNPETGYGRFAVRHGEQADAHRFSYLLARGSIPTKHDVHHECHVRRCVNPAHLEALTRSENLRLRKLRRP